MMPATRMTPGLAQDIADAMTLLHPGWQVPGCKALLRDALDLAPAGELARAALAFAEAPDVERPSLEVFRDTAGAWWHMGTPEYTKRLRPAELPRCPIHAPETLPCRWCEAERKAEANPPTPVVMVSDEQRVINVAGLARAQAALAEARRS